MSGPDDRAYSRRTAVLPRKKRVVSPDDRGVNRATPIRPEQGLQPKPPPVSILQNYGFHGPIDEFVKRLNGAVSAHFNAFGYKPSPGLAFDLARYNHPDYAQLFGLPTSKQAAGAVQAVKSQEPQKPHLLQQIERGNVGLAAEGPKDTTLADKYPTVQVGVLPIKEGGAVDDFFRLANELGGKGQLPVREQGQTLDEYAKMLAASGIKKAGDLDEAAFGKSDASKKLTLADSITKLKDAQTELNMEMGTDLPVTGIFNQDWLQAVSNWMGSEDYFKKVVKKQASDAGFNSPQDFQKAWKNKTKAVHASGFTQHFVNAMPLQLFHHGNDPLNILRSTGEYVTVGYAGLKPWEKGFYDPTRYLHTLTRTAGLALGVIGGTVQQSKADLAAAGAFVDAVAPGGIQSIGKGDSLDEAKAKFRQTLAEHPSWVRVLFPDHPKWAESDYGQVADIVGDIVLLRKPAYTGESLAAGSAEAASKSTYLNYASKWAFNDLKKGNIGRANARLEGGLGAEKLVARTAPLIKNGNMSEEQFKTHLAELYAHGKTTITRTGGEPLFIQGPALSSLRAKTLPTPGTPGKKWLESKNGMRKVADGLDSTLRGSGEANLANKFVNGIRAAFQHNVSGGAHGLSDIKMPERIHDGVLKRTKNAQLANEFESKFVEFRAKENYIGIKKLEAELGAKYNLRFPMRPGGGKAEPFDATLGTEAPSTFHFPSGGQKEADTFFTKLEVGTTKLNGYLVSAAQYHARLILGFPGTGFSLFYKHMVSDTLRRGVAEEGFIAGYTPAMKKARAEVQALANSTPQYSRLIGTMLARSRESETRWLLNRGSLQKAEPTFKTSEHFGKSNYMKASGGYLRRRLDDDALNAYREASAGGGLEPLVKLILKNKTYRGMWKSARKTDKLSAEEYAQLVFQDFRNVEDGLLNSGSSFDDALSVLQRNRGAGADKALGSFIKDNRIDFEVQSGQVQHLGAFDGWTGSWIEKLMTFNKWNRGQLATRMLHKTYADLRATGMEQGPALEVAADLAERITVHHMLDFANRLQIEQDLRWLSYFATKHRLYWKWVLGTTVRHPGYSAAIMDAQHALGGDGNLDFTLHGNKLAVPLARLMWIPGKEYSELSPLALAAGGFASGGLGGAANAAAGNFGNILTRNDTTVHYLVKLGKIKTGQASATYGYAIAGLDERSKAFMNARINSYQNDYFNEHGFFAPESEAVKHVLWASTANEAWRSNLPLPVIPTHGENNGQKLLRQFMALNDPKKRRKFLDDHSELSLYFGIYQDPNDYLHVRPLWQRYTQALDTRDAIRSKIYEQIRVDGYTPELKTARKKADEQFGKVIDALKKEDLDWTPLERRREIEGENLGIWGQQISTDPLIDPRKVLGRIEKVTGVPAGDILPLPAQTIKNLRIDLKHLSDPDYIKTFDDPNEAKFRRGEILQRLEIYKSYPKDALGSLELTYNRDYVGKYWDESNKRYDKIVALPKNEKEVAYAELRAWKDKQDKPVVIDGIKFPSPLRMAWATLDPTTKRERLAGLASGSWDHLADYEKELLGKKVPEGTSQNWAGWTQLMEQYRQNAGMTRSRLPKGWGETVAKYVERHGGTGFYKEYLFAQKPAFVRLAQLTPILQSQHHSDWVALLGDAKVHRGDTSQYWRNYVNTWVKPQLARPENRAFEREVNLYGPDFLYGLIN
jgi:hypothetical protein